MKILQVDGFCHRHTQSNVRGLSEAYRRVAELHTFDYRKVDWEKGRSAMNEQLIQFVAEVKPDLIHLQKCEWLAKESFEKIRKLTTAKIIHVFPDYRPQIPSCVVGACPHVDWSLRPHRDPGWAKQCQEAGCHNVGFWWPGTDPEIFKPHPLEKKYDLVMMAHRAGDPIPDTGQGKRDKFLLDLVGDGLQAHLFGDLNEGFAAQHEGLFAHEMVDLGEFARAVSAAKIALAFNTDRVLMYCSWRRLFNTMAAGCFIAVHYFPGLESVFKNGQHLVWFKTSSEAIGLIRYYLVHTEAREAIAGQGREEVIAKHAWDIRVKRMLRLAFEGLDEPIF